MGSVRSRDFPSSADCLLEPLLEGMEDNAAYFWIGRRAPLSSHLMEFAGRSESMLLVILGVLGTYAGGVIFGPTSVLWTFAGIVAWRGLHSLLPRSPDGVLLGRPLREWADLAATPISAEEVARGLWAHWVVMHARASRRLGIVLSLGSLAVCALGLRAKGDGMVLLIGCIALAGWSMAGFALFRTRANPWLARDLLLRGLDDRGRAVLPDFTPRGADREDAAELDAMGWRSIGEFSCRNVLVGVLASPFVITGVGLAFVQLVTEFEAGRALPALAIESLVAFGLGVLLAKAARESDPRRRADRFRILVAHVRGAMEGACLVVHGPDALVTGHPFRFFSRKGDMPIRRR